MISDRLNKIVEYKGISARSFALKIGVSSQVFGRYLKDREPSFDVLKGIVETFGDISPEWLLTGKGSMTRVPTTGSDDNLVASQQRIIESLSKTIENLTNK